MWETYENKTKLEETSLFVFSSIVESNKNKNCEQPLEEDSSLRLFVDKNEFLAFLFYRSGNI